MVLGEGLGSNVQPCRSLRVETAELKAAGLQVKAAGVRASGHWHACRQLASAASGESADLLLRALGLPGGGGGQSRACHCEWPTGVLPLPIPACAADYVFNRLESALATIRRHQQQQEQDDSE